LIPYVLQSLPILDSQMGQRRGIVACCLHERLAPIGHTETTPLAHELHRFERYRG
jgi:hypothetical protein